MVINSSFDIMLELNLNSVRSGDISFIKYGLVSDEELNSFFRN